MKNERTVRKYYGLELLRFIFAVMIVVYHILHDKIMLYVTDPAYAALAERTDWAKNIVACFFIMGGYFLYRSYQKTPDVGIFSYICRRAVRLWPLMILATLPYLVTDWSRALLNGLFLQCSGLSLEYHGILWYVSVCFWAGIFLYGILRCFGKEKGGFLIGVLSFLGLTFLVNYLDGAIYGRETVYYGINLGMVSGISCMGVGVLIGMLAEKLEEIRPSQRIRKGIFAAMGLFEVLALYFFYRFFLCSQGPENHMVLVIIFSGFLLCLQSGADPLGWLLDRSHLGFLGKYAYAVYVFQEISFWIMEKTLWQITAVTARVWLALGVSVCVSVLLGMVMYYLVEKPCQNWYDRRYGC